MSEEAERRLMKDLYNKRYNERYNQKVNAIIQVSYFD